MFKASTYQLIEIFDGFRVIQTWTFRAANEIDIARHLCQHRFEFDRLFSALDISPKEAAKITPEALLKHIEDSPINGRHDSVLYLLRVPEQAVEIPPCAESPPAVRNGAPTSVVVSPGSADASRG